MNMKGINSKLLIFLFIIIGNFNSFATKVLIDKLYYNINGTTATVAPNRFNSFTSDYREWSYEIPEKIYYNGVSYTVVGIEDYAFSAYYSDSYGIKGSELRTVTIPNTVKTIGYGAFRGCENLRTVTISGSESKLQEIGATAFMDCPVLSEISIPKDVTKLGTNVFSNSYIQTIEYFGVTPPENWVVAAKTYVTNKKNYITPTFSLTEDYELIEFISFSNNEFKYNGSKVITSWIDNRYSTNSYWSVTAEIPELESQCGEYRTDIVFHYKLSYNSYYNFDITIPYYYSIDPITLDVIINNTNRLYGEENPIFTYSCEGFVNNENESVLLQKPILNCSASKNSDIGKYPIVASNGLAKNYIFNYQEGSLEIKKSPIRISVNNIIREYGINNPEFTLTFTGLKNNESYPEWDVSPSFNTNATILSNVGNFDIKVVCSPHNYEIIENKPGVLTITKAPLTLKVINQERPYFQNNPPFEYSLIGLRNNDDKTCISSQPVFQCNANKNSDCGKYDITASGADANNYELTFEKGILTINPISLTLRASNISREYGEPNQVLRFEAIGLAEIDDIDNALQEFPTLSTNAVETSNVGEYAILIKGGKAKNYTISLRDGVLTINKAPLAVIAENAERIYGENNPIFKRSYLGFKLSDSETTAFSSLPRLTCSATKFSDVGEYPIVVEGGTARNYEINNYENGILIINQATLILKANDKSRLYYESNPQFDYTLIGLKNSDSKSCITTSPSYECSAELNSNVGLYQIVPKEATAKNYSIEYQNGNLTINQRTLTASVGNYTRNYNTDNPVFEVFYDGFVNNENYSVLTHLSVASCSAMKTSDVGSYTISVSGGDAINYVITKYNNGILTIEKADQSIVWDQDLSNVKLYSQIALNATSSASLPITYEMSPNNVVTLYDNGGVWYLDCYGSGAVNIRAVQNGNKNYNSASVISKTLVVNGGGNDPSNPQIYLHVETAGSLSSLIADSKKNQIKNLRLSGYLNGTDINYFREMAGCDSYGNSTTGILESLDISQCTIVSGGRSYYLSNQTSNYEIGNYMFYNCNMLVNLMLPDNTTNIRSYAFADCGRLSVISIPNSVTSFGANTFQNDISLLRIPMPTELTSIGDKAFYGCNGLSELTITQKVRSIGDGILSGSENITKVNVECGNKYFISKDGVLYNYSLDELLIYPVNYSATQYVVPEGVSKIAPYAFNNAKKLTDVVLPSSLTSIGTDAFIGCVNLNSIRLLALNPPLCQNDCFEQISKTRCELRVPKGCYSYFWVAPVWSDFNHMVEMEYNSIFDAISDGIKIIPQNELINILNVPSGQSVSIYQTNGMIIYNVISDGNPIQYQCASKGTIIVVASNKQYKLFIK